jgi:hypothetical protein
MLILAPFVIQAIILPASKLACLVRDRIARAATKQGLAHFVLIIDSEQLAISSVRCSAGSAIVQHAINANLDTTKQGKELAKR